MWRLWGGAECHMCAGSHDHVEIHVGPRAARGWCAWISGLLLALALFFGGLESASALEHRELTALMASMSSVDSLKRVMDTACTHNLWRSGKDLVNVRPVYDVTVNGIGGKIQAKYVGDHLNAAIGRVYIAPDMDVDLVSLPQMLKNGCSLSAVGKLMLIKDKDKKIVFRAVRDNSGLYLAHEKDIIAYNVSAQDNAIFEKLWERGSQDGTKVKGVAPRLKGVAGRCSPRRQSHGCQRQWRV